MLRTAVRSGLKSFSVPSSRPTVSCFPFGDQPSALASMFSDFDSTLFSFRVRSMREEGERATATLPGSVGFQARVCT